MQICLRGVINPTKLWHSALCFCGARPLIPQKAVFFLVWLTPTKGGGQPAWAGIPMHPDLTRGGGGARPNVCRRLTKALRCRRRLSPDNASSRTNQLPPMSTQSLTVGSGNLPIRIHPVHKHCATGNFKFVWKARWQFAGWPFIRWAVGRPSRSGTPLGPIAEEVGRGVGLSPPPHWHPPFQSRVVAAF